MLKEMGEGAAAVVDVVMKWALICGLLYVAVIYGWPKGEAYWAEREQAYALVPKLQQTIVQDGKDLAAQKQLCLTTAARTQKNDALIGRFASAPPAPGHAPGLTADDIADLLQ